MNGSAITLIRITRVMIFLISGESSSEFGEVIIGFCGGISSRDGCCGRLSLASNNLKFSSPFKIGYNFLSD